MYQVIDKIVRYSFVYDDIYTEVTKRTSKLGQHRGTEALMHKLNQMSMTKDEDFIFEPQIRQACALVWEQMYPLAKCIPNAYRFNLNTTTKTYRALPKVSDVLTITANGNPSSSQTSTNHYTLTANHNVTTASTPDWTLYKLIYNCEFGYDVDNLESIERRTEITNDIVATTTPSTMNFSAVVFVAENLLGQTYETFEGNVTAKINARFDYVNPTTFNVGDYVEFGNDLYLTLKQTDERTSLSNEEYFLKLAVDDRNSIIFDVNKHHWLDENVFPIVDNAIFEVIVHYIMAKWFDTSAPEEATIYDAKYKSDIVDLRHRIQSQNKPLRNKYKYY